MADPVVPRTIDEYIAGFSHHVQVILEEIRAVIREMAPEATENISYRMPTFVLHGNLVHFAAFKHHIGFYPMPSGVELVQDELSAYKGGKGSLRFPLDQPMPLHLIRKVVAFRVQENEAKAQKKRKRA